ncbi:MAG: four helix bundle protein [Deltaproteobacteria bacterium]|nr:MAG: four helix bundle protein [Deltaproteobacteria bacterium]
MLKKEDIDLILEVALEVVGKTFRLLPKLRGKDFGPIKNQLRRSCPSIASNIAEGTGKGEGLPDSSKAMRPFFRHALGSLREAEHQFKMISERNPELKKEIDDIQWLLKYIEYPIECEVRGVEYSEIVKVSKDKIDELATRLSIELKIPFEAVKGAILEAVLDFQEEFQCGLFERDRDLEYYEYPVSK